MQKYKTILIKSKVPGRNLLASEKKTVYSCKFAFILESDKTHG